MKKQSIEKLAGLTAISTALGTTASGAIVASATLPQGGLTSPSTTGALFWDVDNDGTNDFKVDVNKPNVFGQASLTEQNGAALAVDVGSEAVMKLSSGSLIGSSNNQLKFLSSSRQVVSGYGDPHFVYFLNHNFKHGNWDLGDTGYLGFSFTSEGNTHYGWMELYLSDTTLSFTINEAWYENTPDASILAGAKAVPEPKTVGLGLGVLALGAAGLRRMRQNAQ